MTPTSAVDRAVSEVRQAAFEISATDQRQAYLMLREALKLQPGHPDLLGDLAVLHLQAGRMDACIEAAGEALAARPDHDDSAYAMALALEASGRLDAARACYRELVHGERAARFAAAQPDLAEQCRAKLAQLEAMAPTAAVSAAPPAQAPATSSPVANLPVATAPAPPIAPAHKSIDVAADRAPSGDDEEVFTPRVVRAAGLGTLLRETRGIRALTLDCFDTILWRHTPHPTDVFHDMQQRPAFRTAAIDAALRQKAELYARQLQRVRTGRTEVSLEQIYQAARPGIDDTLVRWLAEDELAAEMAACHAHPGAVQLLRDARARGLPVTIVSDTYLDESRLRRLLAHALPSDAYEAIGAVVCSCDHGVCKSQGLFKIAKLPMPANASAMLHVGDNKDADVQAPRALGISATQLLHDGTDSAQRRAMSAAAACLLDPSARDSRMLCAPYRAVHATFGQDNALPATTIGHGALGPMMHAFVRWIEEEAERLAATHPRVKLLFLMRDAHLPLLAYRELGGRFPSHSAHISRFSAYAASFRRQEHVDHYLAHFANNLTPEMIARQLLLSPERTARLLEDAEKAAQPRQAFLSAVRQPEVMAEIATASAAYRARLRHYLQRQADLMPGDTVMLVDLGYAGTIQRVLGPVMAGQWGNEVFGRYLLAVGSTDDRHRGLLDRSWLDDRALSTLQPYVGLLETLSADDGASAVGYDEDGQPQFDARQVEDVQHRLVAAIQAECLRFVREAEAHFHAGGRTPHTHHLRDEALGGLGRLLFLPSEQELVHLSQFKLEINLGSGIARPLFDIEAGLDGLRRHGMFYVGLAQNGARMAVPAELRAAGMEMSLTMLAQARFGVEATRQDWTMRRLPVPLLVARDGGTPAELQLDALATHDGYFSVLVPLPTTPTDVALPFGRDHAWLQLHSATMVPVSEGRAMERHEADAMHLLVADGVVSHGAGLLNFEHENAMLMFPSESFTHEGRMAIRLTFRPVTSRTEAVQAAAAAGS
ncbi:HAD family hydrolase [Rubrivivax albus]|uniref:Uncharacterized protein n=1 Tax=Rubrivivax albus TaxID=2499835 RepID=A0A437K1W3_9BURK|nr:HAD family hydrolase [Rubrivivax albus]RVT54322.1 hypothetical protein ENE75_05585 [Rubrivivax albus]